jgi:hypothetical protein
MATVPISIRVDRRILLDSGVVIVPLSSEVNVKIGEDTSFIELRLIFKNDDEKGPDISANIISPILTEIVFVNFNNSLGVSLGTPIEVGKNGDKLIFMNIASYSIGVTRMLCYSFYLEG